MVPAVRDMESNDLAISSKLSADQVEDLLADPEPRETAVRRLVTSRLSQHPTPSIDDHLVATYFMALRSSTLSEMAGEIVYHATTATRHPHPGTLLAECTGQILGIDPFDRSERVGLLHIGFPLKGAVMFDLYETLDSKLVDLAIPQHVVGTFPGPAYGPQGLRRKLGVPEGVPALGTILKPTAGIEPRDVGRLVSQLAPHPALVFIKEDENLYPGLPYSPVAERTRAALDAIDSARASRGGVGLIFAPHITGAPNEILDSLSAVLDQGCTGVMFSESFATGTVRMVREATRHLPEPPAIYGHNAGIGVKTRSIWREVIDMLARLDGIDFRQTAPVRPGSPFIKPYGDEWAASEDALSRPIEGIAATMIARAGALDQGNFGLNLAETEAAGTTEGYLFLAGSAINSFKGKDGSPDPGAGIQSMLDALEVHRSGALREVAPEAYVTELAEYARTNAMPTLGEALKQRYPGLLT